MSILQNDPEVPGNLVSEKSPPPIRRVKREQFIPLRKSELADLLARSTGLSASEAAQFRRFCRLVESLFHTEYQRSLEDLKDAYAPFDPDADTRAPAQMSVEALSDREYQLFNKFEWLLERGNFKKLAQEDIEQALAGCSQWGLNLTLDFDIFERLEVFCRGNVIGTRFRRSLTTKFKLESIEVPIYQRLVVIFRLRDDCNFSKFLDTDDVHIKLFKDIPQMDVDMLLPGSRVRMSMLDRCKIVLPTLSGVGITVVKVVQGALVAAALGSYLVFLGLVGGTIGYGLRSFYGYLNTKQKYQLNLTQSLYYQNLDNNAGAIYRLLDEAEEQENREAMLAYFFLWRHAPAEGWSAETLDHSIEQFLAKCLGHDVDFEISDALDKLTRLEVLESRSDGTFRALPIEHALEALERRWEGLLAS